MASAASSTFNSKGMAMLRAYHYFTAIFKAMDSVTPLELPDVSLCFDKQDKKHEVSIMYS